MDANKTYEKTGSKEVWVVSGKSGLEKRQCTVQLTVFADGSSLLPLVIFILKPKNGIDGIRESKAFSAASMVRRKCYEKGDYRRLE